MHRVTLAGDPKLTLAKSVSPTTATAAGDRVVFTYQIKNTGNVTITNLGVNETQFSGTGTLGALDCAKRRLAPDESRTCTAGYAITQADVNAGRVQNTAVATGIAPQQLGAVTSGEDSAEVTIARTASFSFAKTASPTEPAKLTVGEIVHYKFVVTNTGNVTLSNPAVSETAFTGKGGAPAVDCPDPTPLAPGGKYTCKATYQITQADIDAGEVSNTARATVGVPDGVPALAPLTDSVNLDLPTTPKLKLAKSVSPAKAEAVGDPVVWSFRLTNTGTVTLRVARVVEQSFTGTGRLGDVVCPAGDRVLAPQASVTCSAAYSVTQADLDAGKVTNRASGTARDPGDAAVAAPQDSAVLDLIQRPGIRLTKTAAPTTARAVGKRVSYSFLIENTGNVTLTDVALSEDEFTGSGKLGPIKCPDDRTLAPGASKTCTADYTVTQADLDAGGLRNEASVAATTPVGEQVTSPATARVWLERRPGLKLTKTADRALAKAGDLITYTFEVTNTGNVTLTGVKVVEEDFTGTGTLSPITCPAGAGALAPGQQLVCTATYVLTPDDVAAGQLRNAAVATAVSPTGPVASVLAAAVVTPPELPFTGGGTGLAWVGVALVAAGVWLVRRRRVA